MKLVVLAEAEAEIDSAAAWYDERRDGLGDEFLEAVQNAFVALAESPEIWPEWADVPRHRPPIRRFLLPRFPYAVGYQAHADMLIVLAVAHQSREPLYWIGRSR